VLTSKDVKTFADALPVYAIGIEIPDHIPCVSEAILNRMPEYVTAIAIIVAGLVAIPLYLVQKWADRRHDLNKQKAESYQRYFDAFWNVNFKAGTSEHPEAHEEYQKALHDVYILGSDGVFLAVTEFNKYIVEHSKAEDKDITEVTKKYANLIIAVRKDGFRKTKLSNEEIRERLTISI
jgi:hypothetical protein